MISILGSMLLTSLSLHQGTLVVYLLRYTSTFVPQNSWISSTYLYYIRICGNKKPKIYALKNYSRELNLAKHSVDGIALYSISNFYIVTSTTPIIWWSICGPMSSWSSNLHLGVGPSRNLDDHIVDMVGFIGVQWNVVERGNHAGGSIWGWGTARVGGVGN